MTLVRWNPFNEIARMTQRMNRLMEDFFGGGLASSSEEELSEMVFYPPVDIKETKDDFRVTMELPGVNKNDVSLELVDNTLTIRGERKFEKEDKGETYHRIERSYGSFVRSFTLPSKVKEDGIEAVYKDGVLTVTIPKVEEAKPKKITIK